MTNSINPNLGEDILQKALVEICLNKYTTDDMKNLRFQDYYDSLIIKLKEDKKEYYEIAKDLFPKENIDNYLFLVISLIALSAETKEEFLTLIETFIDKSSSEPEQKFIHELLVAINKDKSLHLQNLILMTVNHYDLRGTHSKFFTSDVAFCYGFNEVREIFTTTNRRGTLRGLHRQLNPTQQKIVKPITGKFNLRVVTPYYHDGELITASIDEYNHIDKNSAPIFVPEGAYLGYVSLEDESIMLYVADGYFNGDADDGVNPLDPTLNVNWGYNGELIMSDRDKQAPNLLK